MSSAGQQRFDDQVLVRYLLGTLPEEEAERLDGLSIEDDAFAWQLNAVENDLVDGYVRGELSIDDLARFKNSYLSSPKRLQKLEFAEALSSFGAKTAAQAVPATMVPGFKPKQESSRDLPTRRWFSAPRLALQWEFAGGALVLLFAVGYLLLDNVGLRRQTTVAQGSHAAVEQHEQELQQQLNDQRAANAELAKEVGKLRESQPNLDQLKTLSAVLLPPTRGASRLPSIAVPPGTSLVVLVLGLESTYFKGYRAVLKDPATNQIVWRSMDLQPPPGGENKYVSISFPARLLQSQNYTVELTGVSANGAAELITSYTFHAALR